MNDSALLNDYCSTRNEAAFSEIVLRHERMVLAAALRVVGDQQTAEDVAQEVFVTLCRRAASLPPGTVLSGWLYRTAIHLARNARRARQREKQREKVLQMNERSASPAQQEQWAELQPHIDAGLPVLPQRQRDAVVLRLLLQRPPAECAAEMRCSENAVSMRLQRGLEGLRARLARHKLSVSSEALSALLLQNAIPGTIQQGAVRVSAALRVKATKASTAATKGTLKWVVSGSIAAGAAMAILFASVSVRSALTGVLQQEFRQNQSPKRR